MDQQSRRKNPPVSAVRKQMASQALHALLGGVEPALKQDGFIRRRGAIFTLAIDKETLGWINLNFIAQTGLLSPLAGVVHVRVEKIVAKLYDGLPGVRRSRFAAYEFPTIVSTFAWTAESPQDRAALLARYHWFLSAETYAIVAERVIACVRAHVLPYIARYASLDAVGQLYAGALARTGNPPNLKVPVAFYLLGQRDKAERYIEAHLARMDGRTDRAAEVFRSSVKRLIEISPDLSACRSS